MAGQNDNRKLGYRILLGVVVALLGGSMLLYLVPQIPGTGEASTDVVAKVGRETITTGDIRQQLAEIEQRNPMMRQMEGFVAQQILKNLVQQKEIEYEAKRMGIHVTNEEIADRIKLYLPTAFNGDSPVAMDQYAAQVQQRFQMTVPKFEEALKQSLLDEKFRKLVTDGISVGPAELQDEFRYRNEKVKLDYALIKPEDLEAKVNPSDAEIKAEYDKNKAKYQVPEKRIIRFGLVDLNQIRQTTQISDDQLKAIYQKDVQQYQVPNRVHVEHILFMTVGKPDAEVEEIKHKAEDVLKQAKKGANFEELAKKYSEDPGSKDKNGDLGWIVEKQTVPEFEKTAFSLPKGTISDLVKTQYGFHIIKVLEKEQAHTRPFDEVKNEIRASELPNRVDAQAAAISDQLAGVIRRSNKVSLDDVAKQFNLTVGEAGPLSATDPILALANSQEAKAEIFRLRTGELSAPIRTDRGYVVLTVKDIQPAHQGTLEEVRDRVVADLKRQKAVELARTKAEDLAKRVKAGEKFETAAKALDLTAKNSDLFARNGTVPGIGSGKQLALAFRMKQGDVSIPMSLGASWVVYRVAEKTEPNPADFDSQKKQLVEEVLQTKRGLAYQAFQTALETRLKQEGKLKIMQDKLSALGSQNQSNL